MAAGDEAELRLYWLPLGAGGRSVRWNGRRYETLLARHQHRPPVELYHSALEVEVDGDRFTIEMTPVWGNAAPDRGVVQEGPVGSRWLGRSRLFRYEVRLWRDGVIPDIAEAVGGPVTLPCTVDTARRLLSLVPTVPALTWGRDESRAGEMWNSNSLTAWLLASTFDDVRAITPPSDGRAPGWSAGRLVAARPVVGATGS